LTHAAPWSVNRYLQRPTWAVTSCAIFEDPATDTLEQAQQRKLERATAKLRLRQGMTVAEIGSGWGAFAIHIAATTGARVTAINVSPEQLRTAREHADVAGVGGLVEFHELDYRALEGRFDRVVSVGMMEHVGSGQFDAYFGKIRNLLKVDGFALVHCIGRMRPPSSTGPFIRKYIFPGAYVPSLSEVFAATKRADLWTVSRQPEAARAFAVSVPAGYLFSVSTAVDARAIVTKSAPLSNRHRAGARQTARCRPPLRRCRRTEASRS
jgi:cyclopropane fatty-acyl-phospholipid synthase-like methyltransferase